MQEKDLFNYASDVYITKQHVVVRRLVTYYKIKDLRIEISVSLDNTQGLKM